MASLNSLRMMGLDDFTWPVSILWHTAGPQGFTQQELTVDVPVLNGMHDETIALAGALWDAVVAPATTSSVQLLYSDVLIWHEAPLPGIGAGGFRFGRQPGRSASRAHSGVLLFHSGHDDDYAARRMFAYGMPERWTDGELLTEAGWDNLMAWGHALSMGLSAHFAGGTMQLLLMYPGVVESVPENLLGVGFRRVTDIRVCQYVDKAPELSTALWPS